jgi:hypothetical protein
MTHNLLDIVIRLTGCIETQREMLLRREHDPALIIAINTHADEALRMGRDACAILGCANG